MKGGLIARTKKADSFSTLMALIKPEYDTPDKIRSYTLEKIQERMREKNFTVRKLAKFCFMDDYSPHPIKYLRGALDGKNPMTQEVLCIIACGLELRIDELFPFKPYKKEQAYEIEKKMAGRDIRDDPLRKDYDWKSLGALRCLDLMEILYN
jgi:transcriptional regulator with XRE-family HTH domain